MIVIDLPTDLNMEDDEGRNLAKVPDGKVIAAGDVAVAGVPGFWSWVIVDEVSDGFVFFTRVSATDAAQRSELAVVAPAS